MDSKNIQAIRRRENLIHVNVYQQEFSLDIVDSELLIKALLEAGACMPNAGATEPIMTMLESEPDPSIHYLEAVLQTQAAHLADTRGILELTLNHIFGGRPAPQPTTPGENNV